MLVNDSYNEAGVIVLDNSNEGDLIFDPCMGSGSTLYVAQALNRKILGCELNKEYFESAKNRIELAQNGIYNMTQKETQTHTKKLF